MALTRYRFTGIKECTVAETRTAKLKKCDQILLKKRRFSHKKSKKNDEKSTVCNIITTIGVVAGFSKKAKCFYQKNDPATLPVKSYSVDIPDHEKKLL